MDNYNINDLVGKGKYTGPWSRYISGIGQCLIIFLILVTIKDKNYIYSIILILPILFYGLSIPLIFYFYFSDNILYLILISLYLVSNITAFLIGKKHAQLIIDGKYDISHDFKIVENWELLVQVILLGLFNFIDGAVSVFAIVLFLISELYIIFRIINKLKYVKTNNFYDDAINYLNLIKNDKDKINNKEKTDDYLDYFEHEKDITEKIKTDDPMTIIKEGMTERQFYEDGKLEMICEIDNQGTKNGEYVMYYDDGNIRSKGKYKNGFPDGLCVNYFQNGKISMESYFKEGILDGEVLLYWETGQLQSKTIYKNGDPVGDPEIFFR